MNHAQSTSDHAACFNFNTPNANHQCFLRHPYSDVFDDHAPPHFHVQYAEYQATVDIQNLALSSGNLPRRAQGLVLDWAELHQAELLEDWQLCADKQQPKPIAPLK